MLKSLKFNESANTNNARHVSHRGQSWRWKTFDIDSVVNAVNFGSGTRTALAKKLAAVIGLGRDELGRSADLAKKIVAAQVLHEILTMCRDAERNAGNFLQKNCGMRRAIGKMHMHMIDPVAREEVGEIEGVARALLCLYSWPISFIVSFDQIPRPAPGNFCFLL